MKFTSTPPTEPGFYAWKSDSDEIFRGLARKLDTYKGSLSDAVTGAMPEAIGGEWCRLVPAEELKKAYAEGWAIPDYIDPEVAWNSSRAKQISEGKE